MIAQLKGILIDTTDSYATIDVNGVGYAVHTTDQWKSRHTMQSDVLVFIYTHVKEEALELYGFDTKRERTLFELLLSVSGIGPRTSLTILNRGVQDVETAIAQADVSFFTSIPRIGKKNAQKIIIELKQKIGSVAELNLSDENSMEKDVFEALTQMGFPRYDVSLAIQTHIVKEATLEINIKNILKVLSKRSL